MLSLMQHCCHLIEMFNCAIDALLRKDNGARCPRPASRRRCRPRPRLSVDCIARGAFTDQMWTPRPRPTGTSDEACPPLRRDHSRQGRSTHQTPAPARRGVFRAAVGRKENHRRPESYRPLVDSGLNHDQTEAEVDRPQNSMAYQLHRVLRFFLIYLP